MIPRAARGERTHRLARLVFLVIGIGLVVLAGRVWYSGRVGVARSAVLVAAAPVQLWSWNREDNSFVVTLFPSEAVVDAVGGYGKYSLAALWKLGFIDKKEGDVLADTLANTIAVPVPWFLGKDKTTLPVTDDPIKYAKTAFSFRGFFPYLLGRISTNMPIGQFVSFAWALSQARPDAIVTYDLVKRPVTARELLPDGSTQEIIDIQQLDVVLKSAFESEAVRGERQTVAVYNTTTTPFLGSQAARVLTNQGILVVAVGNEPEELERCSVSGLKTALSTKTAVLAKELFSCEFVETKEAQRADLIVRLGREYAKTFLHGELKAP